MPSASRKKDGSITPARGSVGSRGRSGSCAVGTRAYDGHTSGRRPTGRNGPRAESERATPMQRPVAPMLGTGVA